LSVSCKLEYFRNWSVEHEREHRAHMKRRTLTHACATNARHAIERLFAQIRSHSACDRLDSTHDLLDSIVRLFFLAGETTTTMKQLKSSAVRPAIAPSPRAATLALRGAARRWLRGRPLILLLRRLLLERLSRIHAMVSSTIPFCTIGEVGSSGCAGRAIKLAGALRRTASRRARDGRIDRRPHARASA
jgi:hypothetical protein